MPPQIREILRQPSAEPRPTGVRSLTLAAETPAGRQVPGQLPEAGGHAPQLGAPQAWVQIRTLPHKGYMILGKSFNFSLGFVTCKGRKYLLLRIAVGLRSQGPSFSPSLPAPLGLHKLLQLPRRLFPESSAHSSFPQGSCPRHPHTSNPPVLGSQCLQGMCLNCNLPVG